MRKFGFILTLSAAIKVECACADRNNGFVRGLKQEELTAKRLMNSLSTRELESSEVCLSSKSYCDFTSAPCCQGGCTSANTCYCQQNQGLCFNVGKEDNFCCSNKCGSDGRCECIAEDESCAAGDFCCDGLTCKGGKCVDSGSNDASILVFDVSESNTNRKSNVCQPAGELCFNAGGDDVFCCSGKCGSNRRCKGSNANYNGVEINLNSEPTPSNNKPTQKPRRRPSQAPTDAPVTEKPTRKPSPKPQSIAQSSPVFTSKSSNGCDSGEVKVTVEIKTDKWGGDTSWFLASADSVDKKIVEVKSGQYEAYSVNTVDTCVSPGAYNFTVYDEYGDGVCCAYGDGHIRVLLDDREVLHNEFFKKMFTQTLKVGYDPTVGMTEREALYLDAHNTRRKEWHESNNVSYVPLTWSHQLAFEARLWAEKLLVNCSIAGIEHEHNVTEGENLAKNVGLEETWGQLYPPTKIVGRWVEWEILRPYPGNAHLTQALWRPSKYMGCGESVKDFRNGKCRVQVCRYSRAGNCDMGRYNATFDKNWLPPMLADTSRCGPDCPPEGCY
ncbi:hypothetical protein ACHAWO_000931 [Cyclotella atomus]|uniref:SCP domain-containing protein n=1 Tax=Cyclotella atomus TaxID=382360 RepID=A0ABD3N8H3_9STRA